MNRQNIKKIFRIGGFVIFFLIVVGYALFNSYGFIQGPQIIIDEPENGSTFTTSSISIRGRAIRTSDISLNGKSIVLDETGRFSATTLLFPGYNALTLETRDKYARKKEYRLEFIYEVD